MGDYLPSIEALYCYAYFMWAGFEGGPAKQVSREEQPELP